MFRGINLEIIKKEIKKMVHLETRAWDSQDVEQLLGLFHPDMVWPWPRTSKSHDPMEWIFGMGKYNYNRWKKIWQELFDTHKLIHNIREIKKIEISNEGDGAFAVVDIDTLWIDKMGNENHWKGRVCKVYSKVDNKWLITMHTGVLDYEDI